MTYQREFDRRLEIAVVGVGGHCYRNLLPAMTYLPVRIRAMCDLDARRLATTADQYGVPGRYADTAEMYRAEADQLDAVFLAVGSKQHPPLTAEALDAGLPVWMEKPPAMRASQIEELIARRSTASSRSNGGELPVVVGFKKAFMPATDKALEVFGEGHHVLRSLFAQYPMDLPEDGPAVLESGEMCAMLANGCHPLSMMIAVGGPVAAVRAIRAPRGGGVCLLEFAGGALGNFHLAAGMHGPCERYSFFGEGVQLDVENAWTVTLHRGTPGRYGRTVSYCPPGDGHGSVVWQPQNYLSTLENMAWFTQGVYAEMMYFCRCVLDGRPARRGSLEFALEVMRVYEAALVSEGERVELAPADGDWLTRDAPDDQP